MNIQIIQTLIQREFWENRGLLIRTPFLIGLVLIVITAISSLQIASKSSSVNFTGIDSLSEMAMNTNSQFEGLSNKAKEHGKHFAKAMTGYSMAALLLGIGLASIYLTQCLHTDRKDKSILFFRSLPISEWETVLSKLITATWVFPFVFFAFAMVSILISIVILYLLSVFVGTDALVKEILHSWKFFSLSGLLHFAIKAFTLTIAFIPINCWLLFSSAVAKRSPMAVSIGIPLLIAAAEGLILHSGHFIKFFGDLIRIFFHNTQAIGEFNFSVINWNMFIAAILISLAFLFATVWLRENRYEI